MTNTSDTMTSIVNAGADPVANVIQTVLLPFVGGGICAGLNLFICLFGVKLLAVIYFGDELFAAAKQPTFILIYLLVGGILGWLGSFLWVWKSRHFSVR